MKKLVLLLYLCMIGGLFIQAYAMEMNEAEEKQSSDEVQLLSDDDEYVPSSESESPEEEIAEALTTLLTAAETNAEANKEKALFKAIKELDAEKVKLLLKERTNPNALNAEGKTPLAYSLEFDELPQNKSVRRRRIIEMLCTMGADTEKVDSQGRAAVTLLKKFGRQDLKRTFSEKKTIHEKLLALVSSDKEQSAQTVPARVQDLIDLGADVNAHDENGVTVLMWAMIHGKTQLVNILLNIPTIDTRRGDKKGNTALMWGAVSGCIDCVKLLLEKDKGLLEIKNEWGCTALFTATQAVDYAMVTLLLKYGADVHVKDRGGFLPLHYACGVAHQWSYDEKSRLETVRILLEKDPSLVDAGNIYGMTALMHASMFGYVSIVECLLAYHADVTKINTVGDSALLFAIDNNHKDIIKMLLQKGAFDSNAPLNCPQEKDPLSRARIKRFFDIEALLEDYSADNQVDQQSMTRVHKAAQSGDYISLKLLLDRACIIDACNHDGMTPLLIAAQNSNQACVAELIKQGANVQHKNKQGQGLFDVAQNELIPFIKEQIALRDAEHKKRALAQRTALINDPKIRNKLLPCNVYGVTPEKPVEPAAKKQAVAPSQAPQTNIPPMVNSSAPNAPSQMPLPKEIGPAVELAAQSMPGARSVSAVTSIAPKAIMKGPAYLAHAPIPRKVPWPFAKPAPVNIPAGPNQAPQPNAAPAMNGPVPNLLQLSPAGIGRVPMAKPAPLVMQTRPPLYTEPTIPLVDILPPVFLAYSTPVLPQNPIVQFAAHSSDQVCTPGFPDPKTVQVVRNVHELTSLPSQGASTIVQAPPLIDTHFDELDKAINLEIMQQNTRKESAAAVTRAVDTNGDQHMIDVDEIEDLRRESSSDEVILIGSSEQPSDLRKPQQLQSTAKPNFVARLLERVISVQNGAPALKKLKTYVEELLFQAIKKHDTATVTELLSFKIDLNVRNEQGYTPLCYAVGNGFLDIAELLIKNGAQVNLSSKNITPLMMAAYDHNKEMIACLMQARADTTLQDAEGQTALMVAALKPIGINNRDLLVSLCDRASLLTIKDTEGKTIADYVSAETLNALKQHLVSSAAQKISEKIL